MMKFDAITKEQASKDHPHHALISKHIWSVRLQLGRQDEQYGVKTINNKEVFLSNREPRVVLFPDINNILSFLLLQS